MRMFLVVVMPSICGIWMSISTTSKELTARMESTSAPLLATVIVCPIFCRMRVATTWLTWLSSARRIFNPPTVHIRLMCSGRQRSRNRLVLPKHLQYFREQFQFPDWFEKVRGDAQRAATLRVSAMSRRREQHNRHHLESRSPPNFLDKGKAVHLRHVHVRQEHLIRLTCLLGRCQFGQSLLPAVYLRAPHSPAFQILQ